MSKDSFWSGVAAGAAGTAAGLLVSGLIKPRGGMARVERTIHIRRSATEVFSVFAQVERMPQYIRSVVSVAIREDVSLWVAEIERRRFEWDVEVVQVVPKRLIVWKSLRGPEHTGRLSFFAVGESTFVNIELSYVPDASLGQLFEGTSAWTIGNVIEAALRDLKAVLESKVSRWNLISHPAVHEEYKETSTGTLGPV